MSATAKVGEIPVYPLETHLNQILSAETQVLDSDQDEAINVVPPGGMITFAEQRSCFELSRLVDTGNVDLTPTFQRADVWKLKDQSKFIDSLAKELPIPSLCIALDSVTEKRIVVDGKQRITAIHDYLGSKKLRLAISDEIMPEIAGKTHEEVGKENPIIYSRIENLSIPITTIRLDLSRKDHLAYLSLIFKRLNQGGLKINAQEIRNAIFTGDFVNMVRELAQDRLVFEAINIDNSRQALTEMIVRFFAFNESLLKYYGKLAVFLDEYMATKSNINDDDAYREAEHFRKVLMQFVDKIVGVDIRLKKSKVLLDALLYGISQNLDFVCNLSKQEVQSRVLELLGQSEFQTPQLSDRIFSKEKVMRRLNKAALFMSPRYGNK